MAKNFDDLVAAEKATWSPEAHRMHEAASTVFDAEVNEHAQLGAQFAAARAAQGLTQPALSKLSGIQQAEISRIERGIGNPTAATLVRLADALKLHVTLAARPA